MGTLDAPPPRPQEKITKLERVILDHPQISKCYLVFLMGPTCAGKSSLLQYIHPYFTALNYTPGIVEVGRILRERYPPSHFEGQAAPEKTQEEAWIIFLESVLDQLNAGANIIAVDGQPRSIAQVEALVGITNRCKRKLFVYMYATEEVRNMRAEGRHNKNDEAALNLAKERLRNDLISQHDVLCRLYELYEADPLIIRNTSIYTRKEEMCSTLAWTIRAKLEYDADEVVS